MNEAGVQWISYPHFIATTVNGLGISTAFGFRDYDTEEISAHWTGPAKYLAIIPA